MRFLITIFIIVFVAGCSQEKKTRTRIAALEQVGNESRYEVGIACMRYLLENGNNLEYSKDLLRKLLEIEFFSEAASAAEFLLEKFPNDAELFHLRGIAYRRQHQYQLAFEDGLRALQFQPDNNTFSKELTSARIEFKVWNEIQSLNEALANRSDSFDILFQRAEKFFAINQYDAVLYDLGSISKMRSPEDSIYYVRQVSTLYKDARRPVQTLEQMLEYFRRLRSPK